MSFLFTNGHAVDNFTTIYDMADISNIEEIVDFKATREPFWKNDNDLDIKRRKEAEFLIDGDIPTHLISAFVVYSDEAKQKLLDLGAQCPIKVNKDFYF